MGGAMTAASETVKLRLGASASSRLIRCAVLSMLATSMLLTVPPTPAQATVRVSRVTINRVPRRFVGHVRSRYSFCREDRAVTLYKVRPGTDKALGTDPHTDSHGRWSVRVVRRPGRYYAHVILLGIPYTTRACGADRSRTITLG